MSSGGPKVSGFASKDEAIITAVKQTHPNNYSRPFFHQTMYQVKQVRPDLFCLLTDGEYLIESPGGGVCYDMDRLKKDMTKRPFSPTVSNDVINDLTNIMISFGMSLDQSKYHHEYCGTPINIDAPLKKLADLYVKLTKLWGDRNIGQRKAS